ncbi:MAG TPA: ATP-binding protein [Chthoniobacterales bacterium]|nr:ATP-binding protein [Chthoniobacterales bacterium]
MPELIIGIAAAVLFLLLWQRWRRRWVEPWTELEQLVTSIVERKPPRKFLMTANARANTLGLALEQFAVKHRELEVTAAQGSQSFGSILAALPDGLALVDQQRRILVMNAQFREVFGLREEVAGIGFLEVVRDALVERAVAQALEQGESQIASMSVPRGLDSKRELEVTAVPFHSGEDHSNHAVVLFRDVTQVRQVEEMRRDFVANISHELRTPLSIFRGYLETLLDDPHQPREELVRILEVMDRHADRLTLLVEDILSLAKLESPGARLEYTEIYLPDFLSGILRDWERRFATKLLRATLEAPEDLPVICADEHRLQEVIYNLLDNAVKYSPPEGKIRLTAERDGDSVRISVADEGIGIPSRDLPRIFERFYRADKARSRQLGGTGLGLSIVKHIAQLHGGSVQAQSEPGRGTTISIILPVRPAVQLEEAPEIAQPQFHF